MTTESSAIKLFEAKKIRTAWNESEEEWYFSIIDVVEVLTDSPRPRKYWNALTIKLFRANLRGVVDNAFFLFRLNKLFA